MTSEQPQRCCRGGWDRTGSSLPGMAPPLAARLLRHSSHGGTGRGCVPTALAWPVALRMYRVSLLPRDRLIEQLYGEIAALKEELENFKAEVGDSREHPCCSPGPRGDLAAHTGNGAGGVVAMSPGGQGGDPVCLSCPVPSGFCIPGTAIPARMRGSPGLLEGAVSLRGVARLTPTGQHPQRFTLLRWGLCGMLPPGWLLDGAGSCPPAVPAERPGRGAAARPHQ